TPPSVPASTPASAPASTPASAPASVPASTPASTPASAPVPASGGGPHAPPEHVGPALLPVQLESSAQAPQTLATHPLVPEHWAALRHCTQPPVPPKSIGLHTSPP